MVPRIHERIEADLQQWHALDIYYSKYIVLCRVSNDVPCRGLAFATSAAKNSITLAVKTSVIEDKYF